MEKCNFENDVKVFGFEVKKFPDGVGEAFEKLVNMISEDVNRSYYGISEMTEKGISYKATAEEKFAGEAEKYNCEKFTIKKGEYLAVTLHDWRKKTDCIKDIFMKMMQDNSVDKTQPCIEWYKNDEEMLCMMKENQHKKELHQ
ncbi:MAG: hypothetical protein ACR2FN_14025 [Chitinophagaceae bacterium]